MRATGLETWFSLPRLKYGSTSPPPPRWKMVIVSFIGAYCISSVVQHMLSIYLGQMPLLINLLMTVILVLGLKYFAMPQVDCLEAGYSPKPMIWARQIDESTIENAVTICNYIITKQNEKDIRFNKGR